MDGRRRRKTALKVRRPLATMFVVAAPLTYQEEIRHEHGEQAVAEHVPRFLPPITNVVAPIGGEVWLRREMEATDSVWWQVVSSDGESIARVRAQRSSKIFVADIGRVWGSELGLGDLPYLVRCRIQR